MHSNVCTAEMPVPSCPDPKELFSMIVSNLQAYWFVRLLLSEVRARMR